MKKIFIVVVSIVIIASMSVKNQIKFSDFSQLEFYVVGEMEVSGGIKNGGDTIVRVDANDGENFFNKYKKAISGYVMQTDLTTLQLRQKYNIKVLSTEKIDGKTAIYGYSPCSNLPCEIVGGNKVNVQIVDNGKERLFGVPIIRTSW